MQEFCGEKVSKINSNEQLKFHTIKRTHQHEHQRAAYQAMKTQKQQSKEAPGQSEMED